VELSESDIARFWAKVDKRGPDECWEWKAASNGIGYGRLRMPNQCPRPYYYAHRISWRIHRGPIPGKMNVCHRCDNPRCVNPAHLFLGTFRENHIDKIRKGRGARGERLPWAKLSEGDVRVIRRVYRVGKHPQREIAEQYGVTQSAISAVIRNKSWRWVK